MNDKVKIIRDLGRVCKEKINCLTCELSINKNCDNLPCSEYMFKHPEKSVEIIEKWAKEHPEKTYMDDFFEKFPQARRDENEHPYVCRNNIYGETHECNRTDCKKCWTEPIE